MTRVILTLTMALERMQRGKQEEQNMNQLKITLLPNTSFLKEDGTYDLERAEDFAGKVAGVCYDKEGWEHKAKEPKAATEKRVESTLKSGHHSVYDHLEITFNFQNISKILAMVLNNEHMYTTSEKSARYTELVPKEGSMISERQMMLYEKWKQILASKIRCKYDAIFYEIEDRNPKAYRKDGTLITTEDRVNTRIRKLAQENARYMVTVFMPTQMVHTVSLRQMNYIASWMREYIASDSTCEAFEQPLKKEMATFLQELERCGVLEPRLQKNEKSRKLSLFGESLDQKTDFFRDEAYGISYKGSFAHLAQAHRHRTVYYQMQFLDQDEFFVPPILEDSEQLVKEWLTDIQSVKEAYPQGQLVLIRENGLYEKFIEKCEERLCSAAQLEIMNQTKETMQRYYAALAYQNDPRALEMESYTHGARCTFPNYTCAKDCHFKEGKQLIRKI